MVGSNSLTICQAQMVLILQRWANGEFTSDVVVESVHIQVTDTGPDDFIIHLRDRKPDEVIDTNVTPEPDEPRFMRSPE